MAGTVSANAMARPREVGEGGGGIRAVQRQAHVPGIVKVEVGGDDAVKRRKEAEQATGESESRLGSCCNHELPASLTSSLRSWWIMDAKNLN